MTKKFLFIAVGLLCLFSGFWTHAKTKKELACEDLYSLSCLDEDGSPKTELENKKKEAELFKVISAGRDKVAKAMGNSSTDDAIKKNLKANGFVIGDLTPDVLAVLKNAPNSSVELKNLSSQLSPEVAACYKKANSKPAPKFQELYDVVNQQAVPYRAKDLPAFLMEYVRYYCTQMEEAPSSISKKDNPEINQKCKDFPKLKRKAELLFREEGLSDYRQKSEAFVADNMLPEFKYIIDFQKNIPSFLFLSNFKFRQSIS